ncbi:MAG: hypothetical protein ACKVOH_02975 [Chlamydiales bacterium]
MPSSKKAITQMLAFLPEHRTNVVDLGSGWGGVLRAVPKGYRKKGYEISPIPYLWSKLRGLPVEWKDFFSLSLSEADVIFCYLCPEVMKKLEPKLKRELAKGVIVISNTFAIPGWKPVQVVELDDLYRSQIFFYLT